MITIGKRIYNLRKELSLSQQEFGKLLGIKGPYVSELEAGKKNPSEQLILSICRTLGLNRRWLEEGQGEVYDKASRYSSKGLRIIGEINQLLISGRVSIALSTIRKVLQINHRDIEGILFALSSIFAENDETKIEAVKALLYAFVPKKSEDEIKRLLIEEHRREALESLLRARQHELNGDQTAAREACLLGMYALKHMHEKGYLRTEFDEAKKEFKDFILRDPEYPLDGNIIQEISSIVKRQPGIKFTDLFKEMVVNGKHREINFFVHSAIILGKIKSITKGKTSRFYPPES